MPHIWPFYIEHRKTMDNWRISFSYSSYEFTISDIGESMNGKMVYNKHNSLQYWNVIEFEIDFINTFLCTAIHVEKHELDFKKKHSQFSYFVQKLLFTLNLITMRWKCEQKTHRRISSIDLYTCRDTNVYQNLFSMCLHF